MPNVCLPPQVADKFKQAIIKGAINPERLANMTSEARHKLFSDVVGEGNAKFVNSQFESKLLLKNQQRGFITWAQKLTGVTPDVRRDLISRISKLDRVLDPEEERTFLKDLAGTKLGIDVTAKEAEHIANLSQNLRQLESKRRPDKTFPSETARMNYGRAKVAMGSHLADLKNEAGKLSLKEQALQHPFQSTSKAAGLAKSLKASLDNSAIFRQGWKTLATNPVIWQKNARQSFIDIVKQLGGKETLKEVQADIVSRPNFDKYQKMKLAIGNTEEEFPTTLPEKIPGFGRVYKASEGAYTGFLYRQRADVADKLLQMADKAGVEVTDKKQLESMGKLINSLTGRGHLGGLERSANTVNNIFFSGRFLKSNVDTLTAHQFQREVTPFVRKQAAENLVKIIGVTAGVMALANFLKPGSAELDPRSSNFGKIKLGHTTFDVTGGMGSLATLAARILKQSSKSSTTGVVSKLNSGYGSQTGMDVLNSFFENKLSPGAGLVKDLIQQQDFSGNKPTIKGETANLFTPLPATNVIGNHDPQSANKLLISIADGLGIAASTNTPQRSSQQTVKNSSTQQAFLSAVGPTKYEQANNDYNKRVNDWLKQHQQELNSLPDADQQPTLNSVKTRIQKQVYQQYNFKAPKAAQPSGTRKSLLESVK